MTLDEFVLKLPPVVLSSVSSPAHTISTVLQRWIDFVLREHVVHSLTSLSAAVPALRGLHRFSTSAVKVLLTPLLYNSRVPQESSLQLRARDWISGVSDSLAQVLETALIEGTTAASSVSRGAEVCPCPPRNTKLLRVHA